MMLYRVVVWLVGVRIGGVVVVGMNVVLVVTFVGEWKFDASDAIDQMGELDERWITVVVEERRVVVDRDEGEGPGGGQLEFWLCVDGSEWRKELRMQIIRITDLVPSRLRL